MNGRERVHAVLSGGRPDTTPIGFWRHFPGAEDAAVKLADETVGFAKRVGAELVKITPDGAYATADCGAVIQRRGGDVGTSDVVDSPVKSLDDLVQLPTLDPTSGRLAQELETVTLVREGCGEGVAILETVFSPLTVLMKLLGARVPPDWLVDCPPVNAALRRIGEAMAVFAAKSVQLGADGVFLACQQGSRGWVENGTYARWGVPHDREVIAAVRSAGGLVVLHLHGADPALELATAYGVDGVSWEGSTSGASIREGRERTTVPIVGGLARRGALVRSDREALEREVVTALRECGAPQCVIAPECVLPDAIDEENLRVVGRLVHEQ